MIKKDIPKLIESDEWMMTILRTVRSLHLPDWWIGAGFVRSKVWDTLSEYKERTALSDVDVVYFDPNDLSEAAETALQVRLENLLPTGKWSVTNQARMHKENFDEKYTSSLNAIESWPETATSVAVTLDENNHVKFEAVHGVDDLLNLIVRPTPAFFNKLDKYCERQKKKNWKARWPRIKIIGCEN